MNKFKVATIAGVLAGSLVFGGVNTEADYTVKSGDTAWSISKKLGISFAEFQAMNANTNLSNLRIGQVLNTSYNVSITVPSRNYTVLKGESLPFIGKKVGSSTSLLKKLNPSLKNRNPRVGEIIKVPAKIQDNKSTYLYVLAFEKSKGRVLVQPFGGRMFYAYVTPTTFANLAKQTKRVEGTIITASLKLNTRNDTYILSNFSIGLN